MGWTSLRTNKKHLIEDLQNQHYTSCNVLGSSVRGNYIYELLEMKISGEKFINVTKVESMGTGEWGYKTLSESAGPYWGYDCPKKFLDASTCQGEYAIEFRKRCREHQEHKAKVKTTNITTGMKFKFNDSVFTVEGAYNATGSQYAASNGMNRYRFKKSTIIANLV